VEKIKELERPQYGACTFHLGYLRLQTYTLRMCNTYCFSAARMVARMCLNVTLKIHCVPCYSCNVSCYALSVNILFRYVCVNSDFKYLLKFICGLAESVECGSVQWYFVGFHISVDELFYCLFFMCER
jgi:hypothetical protein